MQIVFYGHNYGVSRAKITIRIMPLVDKYTVFDPSTSTSLLKIFCFVNKTIFRHICLFSASSGQKSKGIKQVIFKYEYEVVYFSRSCDTFLSAGSELCNS